MNPRLLRAVLCGVTLAANADLLLVDGDPIADVPLVEDPAKQFLVIVQDAKR